MTKQQKKKVKNIIDVLSKQYFYDFYKDGGLFEQHISNPRNKKNKKEVEEKIKEMFNI